MNGVLDLHIGLVSLLQKDFCVFSILSNSGCLPVVKGSWWVNLGQMWSIFIIACDKDRDTEWSVSSCLSFLLNEFWSLSTKGLNCHWFVVLDEVSLDEFSGFLGQKSEIRTKAWVHGSDVLSQDLRFVIRTFVHEGRWEFLFSGNNDTVFSLDTQRGLSFWNSCKGVLDLGEFTLWGEGC